MTLRTAACRCAKLPGTRIESWRRADDLDHMGFDSDRGRLERGGAIASEAGHQAAGALLAFRLSNLVDERGDPVPRLAVLERHVLLCRERVRVAGRPVKGAGQHCVSHAVARLC